MNNEYFISDLHFGDKNIIMYKNSSLECHEYILILKQDMIEEILKDWNR